MRLVVPAHGRLGGGSEGWWCLHMVGLGLVVWVVVPAHDRLGDGSEGGCACT